MDIVEQMRSFESDHHPDGWPAVQMKQISSLCDEIERLQSVIDAANARYLPGDLVKCDSKDDFRIVVSADYERMFLEIKSEHGDEFNYTLSFDDVFEHYRKVCHSPIPAQQSPALETTELFSADQWWVSELNDATKNGTPDQQRAYCVVLNLLRQIKQSPAADSELSFYGNVNLSEAISMVEQQSPAVAVPKCKPVAWRKYVGVVCGSACFTYRESEPQGEEKNEWRELFYHGDNNAKQDEISDSSLFVGFVDVSFTGSCIDFKEGLTLADIVTHNGKPVFIGSASSPRITDPIELEMHRADYNSIKSAGFESPGELLAAYSHLLENRITEQDAIEILKGFSKWEDFAGMVPTPEGFCKSKEGVALLNKLNGAKNGE